MDDDIFLKASRLFSGISVDLLNVLFAPSFMTWITGFPDKSFSRSFSDKELSDKKILFCGNFLARIVEDVGHLFACIVVIISAFFLNKMLFKLFPNKMVNIIIGKGVLSIKSYNVYLGVCIVTSFVINFLFFKILDYVRNNNSFILHYIIKTLVYIKTQDNKKTKDLTFILGYAFTKIPDIIIFNLKLFTSLLFIAAGCFLPLGIFRLASYFQIMPVINSISSGYGILSTCFLIYIAANLFITSYLLISFFIFLVSLLLFLLIGAVFATCAFFYSAMVENKNLSLEE